MVDLTSGMLATIAPGDSGLAIFGAAIGCGIVIVGAGLGLGLIGSRALDAIARQPEAENRIFMTMIIAAALVEGVTFFALLICFLTLLWMR
jgi:F-type H+-transporting ATPase subunit c